MAREAVELADHRADNVAESLSRLLVLELGVGPVEPQFGLREGSRVAWCDLRTRGKHKSFLNFAARGCFGSQPINHDDGAELYRILALRGHPLDLMRRLITTSLWIGRGAWSNAKATPASALRPLPSK